MRKPRTTLAVAVILAGAAAWMSVTRRQGGLRDEAPAASLVKPRRVPSPGRAVGSGTAPAEDTAMAETFTDHWLTVIRSHDPMSYGTFMRALHDWRPTLGQYRQMLATLMEQEAETPRRNHLMLSELLRKMAPDFPAETLAALDSILPAIHGVPPGSETRQRLGLAARALENQPRPDRAGDWLAGHFTLFEDTAPADQELARVSLRNIFECWSRTDPGAALSQFSRFPPDWLSLMLEGVGRGTESPQAVATNVDAMRRACDDPQDLPPPFLKGLGEKINPGGPETPPLAQWVAALEAAGLSSAQMQEVASGMAPCVFNQQAVERLNWIARHSEGSQLTAKTGEFVSLWSYEDLRPVRQWVDEPPDDPVKQEVRRALDRPKPH